MAYWRTLHSDPGAHFDAVVGLDAAQIVPQVTWGTSPEMVLGIDSCVPDPAQEANASRRGAIERALAYMGLTPGKALRDIAIDKVFIGSLETLTTTPHLHPRPEECADGYLTRE